MGERNSEVRILNKIEVEKAVETHADTIWRLAWIHCNRVQENAEDVFQETFLALVRSKKTFASEEHLKAWLIRVVLNQCKKKYYQRSFSSWNYSS